MTQASSSTRLATAYHETTESRPSQLGWRRGRAGAAFAAPALILLTVFSFLPLVLAVVTSLTDLDLRSLGDLAAVRFVGLHNYQDLLGDHQFGAALTNTGIFAIVGVPSQVIIALAVAVAINSGTNWLFRGLRALYFLPSITNMVAVSLVWGFMYQTDGGLINFLLSQVHVAAVPWLDQPLQAKFALIIVGVWRGLGLTMLILIAGLQGIPQEYGEAARVDGASAWQCFTKITVPLLRPALFFVTVTSTIAWVQFFEEPFVITGGGGPQDGTLSISLYIYKIAFTSFDFGYASAASCLLFVILICITALQFRLRRREVEL